jgi:hypothetical protein
MIGRRLIDDFDGVVSGTSGAPEFQSFVGASLAAAMLAVMVI